MTEVINFCTLQVKTRLIDDFSGLISSVSTPPTSPITESTCIILPPSSLITPSDHPTPHYLQLLELIVQAGFSVTGIQMTHLSERSATTLGALGVNDKVCMCVCLFVCVCARACVHVHTCVNNELYNHAALPLFFTLHRS